MIPRSFYLSFLVRPIFVYDLTWNIVSSLITG